MILSPLRRQIHEQRRGKGLQPHPQLGLGECVRRMAASVVSPIRRRHTPAIVIRVQLFQRRVGKGLLVGEVAPRATIATEVEKDRLATRACRLDAAS